MVQTWQVYYSPTFPDKISKNSLTFYMAILEFRYAQWMLQSEKAFFPKIEIPKIYPPTFPDFGQPCLLPLHLKFCIIERNLGLYHSCYCNIFFRCCFYWIWLALRYYLIFEMSTLVESNTNYSHNMCWIDLLINLCINVMFGKVSINN